MAAIFCQQTFESEADERRCKKFGKMRIDEYHQKLPLPMTNHLINHSLVSVVAAHILVWCRTIGWSITWLDTNVIYRLSVDHVPGTETLMVTKGGAIGALQVVEISHQTNKKTVFLILSLEPFYLVTLCSEIGNEITCEPIHKPLAGSKRGSAWN